MADHLNDVVIFSCDVKLFLRFQVLHTALKCHSEEVQSHGLVIPAMFFKKVYVFSCTSFSLLCENDFNGCSVRIEQCQWVHVPRCSHVVGARSSDGSSIDRPQPDP